MKPMIKIVTGFRSDQYHTIKPEEAHKAYYLFLNPESRGIFDNGLAIIGKNIQSIEPDYNATLGLNPLHKLDEYDYREIREKGLKKSMEYVLNRAKEIAVKGNMEVINKRMEKPPELAEHEKMLQIT